MSKSTGLRAGIHYASDSAPSSPTNESSISVSTVRLGAEVPALAGGGGALAAHTTRENLQCGAVVVGAEPHRTVAPGGVVLGVARSPLSLLSLYRRRQLLSGVTVKVI